MMGMPQRVGSALRTAIFGISAIAFGLGALASTNAWALDVEGTYAGTANCTRYNDDGTVTPESHDITVMITQGNETNGVSDLNVDFNLDGLGLMDGVANADAKKPTKKGEIAAVLCTNTGDSTVANGVITAEVKKADKPTKTKLKKGRANITGPGFNMTCKWSAKRSDASDPGVPACPGGTDSMDSDSTDSMDSDSTDSMDSDSTDSMDSDSTDSMDSDSTDSMDSDSTDSMDSDSTDSMDSDSTDSMDSDSTDSMDSDSTDSMDSDSTDSMDSDSTDSMDSDSTDSMDSDSTDSMDSGGLNPVMGECASDPFICPSTPAQFFPWCVTVNNQDVTTCCIADTVPVDVSSNPRFGLCLGN